MTGFPQWNPGYLTVHPRVVPDLPQEILDKIVELLDPNSRKDRHALKACTVVSSVFRYSSQRRLFSSLFITLHRQQCGQRRQGLHDFFCSNPHVAAAVRTLHLGIWGPRNLVEAPVLRLLRGVNTIVLFSREFEYNDWTQMYVPDGLKQDLLTIMQFDSLERIELQNVNHFPMEYLIHSPRLKDLIISGYGRLGTDSDQVTHQNHKQQKHTLETLRVVYPVVLQQLLSLSESHALSLSRLRFFDGITSNQETVVLSQRLLDLAAHTLQKLALSIYVTRQWHLDLGNLHILRYLSLKLTNTYGDHRIWFLTLESIPEINQLSEVTVCFESVPAFASIWQYLDDLLTRRRHDFSLCRVQLVFNARYINGYPMFVNMPKLKSKGILDVRYL